jgi:NAD(P)-dependent dehydrogenase (short-subunit alcohol dehydrogenase family)
MQGRNAVVIGAAGEIGRAVAMELADRGANLYLVGRNAGALEKVADAVRNPALVDVATLDAIDEYEVDRYFRSLMARRVEVDFLINTIGPRPREGKYGSPSDTLTLSEFLLPIQRVAGSQLLTATRGRKAMRQDASSVIVMLTSSLGRSSIPMMAGITAASDAVQGLARVLAAEFGAAAPRVVCARVDAIPASRTIRESMAANAETLRMTVEQFARTLPGDSSKPLTIERAARILVDLHGTSGYPEICPTGSILDIVSQ